MADQYLEYSPILGVRHELVMLSRQNYSQSHIPAILQRVGEEEISRGLAYLRGDAIGPRGLLFKSSYLSSLYASVPVYFPDNFFEVQLKKLGSVAFCWLIPIYDEEVKLLRRLGWDEFEDRLVQADPDFLNFSRKSIV